MTKNINSTVVGEPYSRVQHIDIDYYAPLSANVTVTVKDHVPLTDGIHEPIGGDESLNFTLLPSDFAGNVTLRDIATGAKTNTVLPMGAVFAGIMSIIRDKQLG